MRILRPLATTLLALCCVNQGIAQGSILLTQNTCPTTTLLCGGNPAIGGTLGWSVLSNVPSPTLGLLVVDFGGPAWNGGAIPQPLGSLVPSLAGCSQLAAGDLTLPMTSIIVPTICLINGVPGVCLIPEFRFVWTIPQNPALSGVGFRTQALLLDPGGPSVSHGCAITIG